MLPDWVLPTLSVLFAVGTPLALWYRFWWGSKSQVTFRQLPDPRERDWTRGRSDGIEEWSNYIHIIAINKGWWTGLIWGVELQEVSFDGNHTVTDTGDETVKIAIETYDGGESHRIDLDDPHQRAERNIPGRDVTHLKFVPFLDPSGDLARHAENAEEAEFVFEATIQDNKRTDAVELLARMDVDDVEFN